MKIIHTNTIPKILAFYLPQFHNIPENDKWWGKGFTEWTAVKSAKPLYNGHEQPRVPLNNNYYTLTDKSTMKWQSSLMHRYGIDGMCFYHYYFKDGKKILEKPAENLLRWKDVDIPFCFCWANESWVRTWSNIREHKNKTTNTWSEIFESHFLSDSDKSSGILLDQEYGSYEAWKKHYDYLSPFFKDDRYIKINNMPVFMIYRPDEVDCLKEMLKFFNHLSRDDGFSGIYFIGTNIKTTPNSLFASIMIQQPGKFFNDTIASDGNIYGVKSLYNYDDMCKNIVSTSVEDGQCLCCAVGVDDTPRRGKGGTVIEGRDPQKFQKTMEQLLIKAKKRRSPLVFINAWNEWGEGNYLEPDERFGYAFLKAVKIAKENVLAGKVIDESDNLQNKIDILAKENNSLKSKNERYRDYWQILDQMMRMIEEGAQIDLSCVGLNSNVNVMIYGCGMLGKHLLYISNKSAIKVIGFIDKKTVDKNYNYDGIPMYNTDYDIPTPDLIIVTVTYAYDNIKQQLQLKFPDTKIISIREVIC